MILSEEEFDPSTGFDPGFRYELPHRAVIVSPPSAFGERRPSDELAALFGLYRHWHRRGDVVERTFSERVLQTSAGCRRAERGVRSGLSRRPDVDRDVPSIVSKFVSDSARDRKRDDETQRREDRAIGAKESCGIGRLRRPIAVCRGDREIALGEDETDRTDLLPGFELSPARLFAGAEGCDPAP
jgi:hypothetical protein